MPSPPRVRLSCLPGLIAFGLGCLGPVALAAPDHDDHDGGGDHQAYRDGADARTHERHLGSLLQDQEPVWPTSFLAFTPCTGGMAAGYPCQNVDLLAFLPHSQMGGGTGNDSWGWTDPLTQRQYALVGESTGTAFVDITEPTLPVYLGRLPPHGANSTWRGIKVYADHAFIISEATNHGMQVFDLRQLRNVTNPPVTFAETAHYPTFGNGHTINVNEDTGFMYPVGTSTCSGGLHMVNVQNPALPLFAGCVNNDGYTHETQCVVYHGPDVAHQGREICFNSNTDTVTIVDVTTKSAPVQLSRTTYAGRGYTHQGWLTDDHRYFLLNDELDEQNFLHNSRTRIWDMADLEAPFVSGIYDGPTTAIDHNLYIFEDHVYEANYRAGLRILDAANVAAGQLTEVGYFDIYPLNDNANFNGAWSTYPYFGNGIVIVNGIEQGLFVLRTTFLGDFALDVEEHTLGVCDPGEASSPVAITSINNYSGSVTLSAQSLPAGASADFSVNPLTAPGTSELALATSGLAPGSYTFDVRGTDGSRTHAHPVELIVADDVADPVTPLAPADGATAQARQPLLSWSSASGATSYLVEVATDPAFASVVHSALVSDTSHTVTTALGYETTYHWRVTAINPCGASVHSPAFEFDTLAAPRILVVDDDDDAPNVRPQYTAALDGLAQTYDVWNTQGTDDEPAAADLAPYGTIVWSTGDALSGASGPGALGEAALASWLDGGGCLLLASQDYLLARGLTPFAQSYLGVGAFTNNVGQTSVKGLAPVFTDLGPYTLSFPYVNRTDQLTAGPGGQAAFNGSAGDPGVLRDGSWYRTTFWGFGLEVIPTAAGRQELVEHFLDWCQALAAVDGDADGVANGEDCAPGQAGLWSAPSVARELRLSKAPSGNLGWLPPQSAGALGVTYDLLRSPDPASFAAADCIESGETDTAATDLADPGPDELAAYLVRVANGCGANLGARSDGLPRSGASCP